MLQGGRSCKRNDIQSQQPLGVTIDTVIHSIHADVHTHIDSLLISLQQLYSLQYIMAEGSDRAGEGVTLCTLNEKGQKQFQKRIKGAADKPDPSVGDYGKAKLPAHKAAFDGNIGALEGIFITQSKSGGIPVADKGISPIHMAIKGNKMDSVK